MTSEEATAWIHSRLAFGQRPGLMRVEALLKRMGNPEKNITMIHIAGTNGKGSTVSYLRSLLEEAGQQVGTFTSPHIEAFNERIEINGQFISDEDLVAWVEKIQPLVAELFFHRIHQASHGMHVMGAIDDHQWFTADSFHSGGPIGLS